MAAMHAACYAHALVPSSLDSAQDALDAHKRGEMSAEDTLDELSQAASMVRSNIHADQGSAIYARTMVQLALRAPAAKTQGERKVAVECFDAVLEMDECANDAEAAAKLTAMRTAAADGMLPEEGQLAASSVKQLKAIAKSLGVDVVGLVEKGELVSRLEAHR